MGFFDKLKSPIPATICLPKKSPPKNLIFRPLRKVKDVNLTTSTNLVFESPSMLTFLDHHLSSSECASLVHEPLCPSECTSLVHESSSPLNDISLVQEPSSLSTNTILVQKSSPLNNLVKSSSFSVFSKLLHKQYLVANKLSNITKQFCNSYYISNVLHPFELLFHNKFIKKK